MLKKLTLLLASLTLFAVAGCASSQPAAETAADEAAPAEAVAAASTEAAADFTVLSWAEVEAAVASGAVLVDTRAPEGYAEGHITGAVNGPAQDEAAFQAVLPESKDTLLIFYCGGPQCSASTKGAQLATALGYTNVAEYKGGYPEWSSFQAAPETESDPQAAN